MFDLRVYIWDILYQCMQFQVTSNMNILESKVSLLKDISSEYTSSLKSAENVRSQCQHFLKRLEFELTMRLNEKNHFITKVGVSLRELLLQDYRAFISKVHNDYCRRDEIYQSMMDQYGSLQQTIKNSQFAILQLKKIKKWSMEEISYNQFVCNREKIQYASLNKENIHFQPFNNENKCYTSNDWKINSNGRQVNIKKEWNKVKLSSKQRREELIILQKKLEEIEIKEISDIMEECISSLTDFSFFGNQRRFQEIKLSQSFSRHTIPEPQSQNSQAASLGLQSMNEDINLLCTELIDEFNAYNGSELQRITEREEEQQESEENPTPQKLLKEQTN